MTAGPRSAVGLLQAALKSERQTCQGKPDVSVTSAASDKLVVVPSDATAAQRSASARYRLRMRVAMLPVVSMLVKVAGGRVVVDLRQRSALKV